MARVLLATLMTVGVIMTIGFLFARGSGVSQATPGSHGDLVWTGRSATIRTYRWG